MNLGDSNTFGEAHHHNNTSSSSMTVQPPPPPPVQQQHQEVSPATIRRTFGNNIKTSPSQQPLVTTSTTNRSPPQPSNFSSQHQQQHQSPSSVFGQQQQHYANTLSPRPTVVSETSSTGAVITPRCPECAQRYLTKTQDASCQTDWGARSITAQQADEASQEGKIRGLLRNDIASALEEAQNKANQLLEMKRQFVEARMKSISDQEAAILQGIPASDRERLIVLQNSIMTPSTTTTATTPHPTVDYLRVARSTLLNSNNNNNGTNFFSPNDEEEMTRLREGAQYRLRALAEEEGHIKAQLELMESNRHHDLEAAAKGRAMLMTEKANALSQWNSASPNRRSNSSMIAASSSTSGSPGKRTKRW